MRAHGYLAFVIGIGLTLWACLFAMGAQDREIAARFAHDTDTVARDTETRLKTYFDALFAIRGSFAVHGDMSRADFHYHVQALKLAERYPGFQVIQWVRRVPEDELARHVEAVRADAGLQAAGYPEYRAHPVIRRPEHFLIEYMEPVRGNESAFGLDLAALPTHLAALELGRDSGELVATERITLVQDASGEPAFVARLPVYRTGVAIGTVPQRREALTGFVAIVFRVSDLMREVVDRQMLQHMHLRIHDTGSMQDQAVQPASLDNLLYDSAGKVGAPAVNQSTAVPGLATRVQLNVGQRRWQMQFDGLAGPRHGREWPVIALIGACGFLVSTLIAAQVFSLQRRRSLAQTLRAALAEQAGQKAQAEQAHAELSDVLDQLRRAQHSLVTSEKMASLGALVAGVAHELNTPIGNSLLTATALADMVADIERQLAGGGVRRSVLDAHLADAKTACGIIAGSLGKAADLIMSFKQVAVDQTSDQRRRFALADVVRDTLATYAAQLRRAGCEVHVAVPEDLAFDSYPGSVSQVLSNLINNALLHAFTDREHGRLSIAAAALDDGHAELRFADDGAGMHSRTLRQIYDPFFTTKMGQGGSGLGMHIVYNLVTGMLKGAIRVDSEPGRGTTVIITLPLSVPQPAAT